MDLTAEQAALGIGVEFAQHPDMARNTGSHLCTVQNALIRVPMRNTTPVVTSTARGSARTVRRLTTLRIVVATRATENAVWDGQKRSTGRDGPQGGPASVRTGE